MLFIGISHVSASEEVNMTESPQSTLATSQIGNASLSSYDNGEVLGDMILRP